MEIAGHEWFSKDGRYIWFDLQQPRGATFLLPVPSWQQVKLQSTNCKEMSGRYIIQALRITKYLPAMAGIPAQWQKLLTENGSIISGPRAIAFNLKSW